ncbi:ribbon-helix-helix domain-containing protein [Candidatus Nitrospira salsa]
MARVNVIIPDQILNDLDRAAAEESMSRSGLLQAATQRYLEERRLEKETAARKKKMEQAALKMDHLAKKFGKWDGVGTIREFRDQRTGANR